MIICQLLFQVIRKIAQEHWAISEYNRTADLTALRHTELRITSEARDVKWRGLPVR